MENAAPQPTSTNPVGVDPSGQLTYKGVITAGGTYDQKTDTVTPAAKSSVGVVDTGSAINHVAQQKASLDSTYPLQTGKNDAVSGSSDKAASQPDAASTAAPSKAYFTNASGQEAEYTQDQLNDTSTQQFLKDNGYVLTKSDGLSVSSDFTAAKKQSDYNDAQSTVENLTKNFLSYNIDGDPAFQTISSNITANYGKLIDAMKTTNDQRMRSFETTGLRNGTTQYANDIQLGTTGEELKQADNRIADLIQKETTAVTNARVAYQNNKFTDFNRQVNAAKDIRNEKSKALTDYNKIITNATKQLQISQNQETKTSDNLIKLAKNGATLTDSQLAEYDKQLGAIGMAKAIYSHAVDQQKSADDLKFAQELHRLPPGSTITRGDHAYATTKVGKLTQVTETAKDGKITKVLYNPDGTIASVGTPSNTKYTVTDPKTLKDATNKMDQVLAAAHGPEGKVSKEDWSKALTYWRSIGGTTKQFVTAFAGHANNAAGYHYEGMSLKQPK